MPNSKRVLSLLMISAGLFHFTHCFPIETDCGDVAVSFVQSTCNVDLKASHCIYMLLFPLLETTQAGLCEMTSRISKPTFPEGDMGALSISLLAVKHIALTKTRCCPQTLLVQSSFDNHVPMYRS